jgi:hypothetical protein
VDAGLFHSFHQSWSVRLCDALNAGTLPTDYFALIEQRTPDMIPDVLALKLASRHDEPSDGGGAVATLRPRTRIIRINDATEYPRRANRITVRHRHGEVVAIVEIVSPGNKASKAELRAFIEKSAAFIHANVHLLVIDLHPPGNRDPDGIHKLIWDQFKEEDFELPPDKPLVLASYDAGPPQVAYVETIGVGDALPAMPIFLKPAFHVDAPLEATYQSTWANFPAALKGLLESPRRRKKR